MKYKTCVTVAEKTPYKIKQVLKIALKKSDYAEVRFDFLKIEQIPEALETIKKDLNKIVCTLRPTAGPFPETDAPSAPFSINLVMISGSEFRIDAVVNPLMIIASQ